MRALVIGGTGPTGPYLVRGLLDRGYEVAILHRGTHESAAIPDQVEHIHADPHFLEPLEPAANFPAGLPIPVREDAPRVESEEENRFGFLIAQSEQTVMGYHERGCYQATLLRYPLVYGPHLFSSPVWQIMRRILDGRPRIVLADGGLTLLTRGYVENVARAVLLCVDLPGAAAGRIYNCGDEDLLTLRQWVEITAATMGHQWEIVPLPDEIAAPVASLVSFRGPSHHQVMSLDRIKSELGYRDVVPVAEALPATVRWFCDHLDEVRAAEAASPRQAPHYEAEDALTAIYHEYLKRLRSIDVETRTVYHPYPHPKQSGLARDHRQR